MLPMNLLSRWLESLDYSYRVSEDCIHYKSPRSSCSTCVDVCPTGAITWDNHQPVINEDLCIECGDCVATCPVQAIEGFLPKRSIKNNTLIMDEYNVATVKELLVYYQKGVTTIACNDSSMSAAWSDVIDLTNQALQELGEQPLNVTFEEADPSDDKLLNRRELFFAWKKSLKDVSLNMTPANWRFNHKQLDLACQYPDHQFVDITLDTERCSLCQACQKLCPKGCLQISDNHFSVSPQQCADCSLCVDICPEGALSIKQMISSASSVKHPIHMRECVSCNESFQTLSEEQDLCFMCSKKLEFDNLKL